MNTVILTYRGRTVTAADLADIRALQAAHPEASRRAFSQRLCEYWDWRQPNGMLRDMVARSLEGTHTVIPSFLKAFGWAGDLLRAGVTRNPMYVARQLFRDPFAASFTGGLDRGPLTAVAKAMAAFVRQTAGRKDATADALGSVEADAALDGKRVTQHTSPHTVNNDVALLEVAECYAEAVSCDVGHIVIFFHSVAEQHGGLTSLYSWLPKVIAG